MGRARCPPLGPPEGGELPDAAPPGASSPGAAPPELAPAAALDSSEAAAPRLAVKAAPTAAPVLRNKIRIKTGTII